jgi:hypothetical protein
MKIRAMIEWFRKWFIGDIPARLVYVGLLAFFVLLSCFCFMFIVALIRLNRRIEMSQLPAEKSPTVFISITPLLPVVRTISPGISDFSWFPDKSGYVFSKKVIARYYVRPGAFTSGKRFRIFATDPGETEPKEIGLERASPKVRYAIGCEDHLAPLVSPDGKKIAFAVSRKDHPSAVYLMDYDGSNIQRITPWYDSIAFGWLTEKAIVFWGSPYSDVDLSRPSNHNYGKSFVVNIENKDIQPLADSPEKRLRIKHVCSSLVKDLR